MQIIGLCRIGRDAELRRTPAGDAVANLSLAFNFGRKGDDNKRPTQWIDASLWGQRAESLIDYLTKGTAVVVTIDDPHIETFESQNGTGSKLVGRISSLELAGRSDAQQGANGRHAESSSQAHRQQTPRTPAPSAPPPVADSFDDDIPF